jgi:hypothetical protein
MNNDDFDILNIPDEPDVFGKPKKKRKNSSAKGKTAERDLTKALEAILGDTWRRVPSSGAFMGGMNWNKNKDMNAGALDILIGDIICPAWFKYTIESKAYSDSPKFHNMFDGNDPTLDKWIEQAKVDSSKCNKDWLLIFKVTAYRKAYVGLDLKSFMQYCTNRNLPLPKHKFIYGDVLIIGKDVYFEGYLRHYKSVHDRFFGL